jgi:Zn-dependent protease
MKSLQFRVSGIPVRVEPIFFILLGFLAWANGQTGVLIVVFMVVAGVSVLVHELGHATAFRTFGAEPRITLTGWGGYTQAPSQPRGRSLVVSLAGPGAGFLAAVIGVALSQLVTSDSEIVETALENLIWVNVIWGIFNLLPILPLDGGHVAQDLFGLRTAQVLSITGAVALGVMGVVTGAVFMTFMAFILGSQSLNALRADRDQPQLEELDKARAALLRGQTVEALQLIEPVAASASSFPVEVTSAELLAWTHLAEGHPEEARAALDRLRGGISRTTPLVQRMVALAEGKQDETIAQGFIYCDDVVAATIAARMVSAVGLLDRVIEELRTVPVLPGPPKTNGYRALQLGLHHAGRYRDAARVGALLFELEPGALVAYNVACSQALAAETEEALAWLDRAVEKGFRDTALLDQDNNFDSIRDTDGFRALRSWMEADPPGEKAADA